MIITSATGHDRKGRGCVSCRLRKTETGAWKLEVLSFQGAWAVLPFKVVFEEPGLKAAAAEAAGFLDRLGRDARVPGLGSATAEQLPDLKYSRIANLKRSPEKAKRKSPTGKKAVESPAVRNPVASGSKMPAQESTSRVPTAVDRNKVAYMLGKRSGDENPRPAAKRSTTAALPIAFTPIRNEDTELRDAPSPSIGRLALYVVALQNEVEET